MSDVRDRDVAIVGKLQNALQEHADTRALAAFLGVYCQYHLGSPRISAADFLIAGNFKHGRSAAITLKSAEANGYVTKTKADDPSKTTWEPTDKLIKLVQAIVDIEAPAWEQAERTRKLFAEARSAS
ncbi:hypothetical protein A3A39_02520 [Candidatus Kaiserbacteria bacterium RIFCSPLOWO2_01_FULL_54_13]|uniref:Uncharacterized protein n=1 Tax=Candidatus Kaiserbacteria bacterium RIFCSPLOWO2_01_FULL_54_13 TaxID=1798512 RepID=A0A1F6F3F8_9BACT|nr:MAG: hypothetical protein A3A39_02520 [Candidatus Kaiserbacteria bacterium RIFCSPLOWO2_01_FULL_54_13]